MIAVLNLYVGIAVGAALLKIVQTYRRGEQPKDTQRRGTKR